MEKKDFFGENTTSNLNGEERDFNGFLLEKFSQRNNFADFLKSLMGIDHKQRVWAKKFIEEKLDYIKEEKNVVRNIKDTFINLKTYDTNASEIHFFEDIITMLPEDNNPRNRNQIKLAL